MILQRSPSQMFAGILATPVDICLLKVDNRNTRTMCEICSKLTIKTPERLFVNFEHISHLVLVFLLLTLNMHLPTGTSLIGKSTSVKYCNYT